LIEFHFEILTYVGPLYDSKLLKHASIVNVRLKNGLEHCIKNGYTYQESRWHNQNQSNN